MSYNAFIFHGNAGFPEENWFPWLRSRLEEKGVDTIVPQFPTPDNQTLEAWLEVLKPNMDKIGENTILIGHSLGGAFALKILESLSKPVLATVFVGTPVGIQPILNYDKDVAFCGFKFDWENIKSKSKHFLVYQSDNDPYVAKANGEELAKQLGVNLNFVPNAGHFNSKAGYTQFEDLYKNLEGFIS